mgnify:CR=1 FL=1
MMNNSRKCVADFLDLAKDFDRTNFADTKLKIINTDKIKYLSIIIKEILNGQKQ